MTSWKIHPTKLLTAKDRHACVSIDNHRIIITGGYNSSSDHLNEVEIFDSTKENSKTTKLLPHLPQTRYLHASIFHQHHVYLIGGYVDATSSSMIQLDVSELLNNNNNTTSSSTTNNNNIWETMPSMKQDRAMFPAVLHDDSIYVLGGWDDDDGTSFATCEIFNISSQQWEDIPSMIQKRHGHAAVRVENQIYVFGGHNYNDGKYLDTVEIYNTNTKSWERGTDMPTPLSSMTAVKIGIYIILSGGTTTNRKRLSSSFLYNTEYNTWITVNDNLQSPIARHTAALCNNDTIFLLGGRKDDNNNFKDEIQTVSFQQLKDASKVESRKNQVIAINDTPNHFSDRLGYATYAKALVKVAQKVEGPNSSFCIGLNAPWGAGKSFLYKLIQLELKRNHEEEQDGKIKSQEDHDNDDDNIDIEEEKPTFLNKLQRLFQYDWDKPLDFIFNRILYKVINIMFGCSWAFYQLYLIAGSVRKSISFHFRMNAKPWWDNDVSWNQKLKNILFNISYIIVSIVGLIIGFPFVLFWCCWLLLLNEVKKPLGTITSVFASRITSIWTHLITTPPQNYFIQNFLSVAIVFLPMITILTPLYILAILATMMFFLLRGILHVIFALLKSPFYQAFHVICTTLVIKIVECFSINKSDYENMKVVRASAMIIMFPYIWLLPWILYLIPSFIDHFIQFVGKKPYD